jgi:hypothetical protein
MNIFASDRIKPENVKFPKGMENLVWKVVSSYREFCETLANDSKSGVVVLDAHTSDNISGMRCAYALTEITCDKHINLPTLVVIGPDTEMKTNIQEHLNRSQKWIDRSCGK